MSKGEQRNGERVSKWTVIAAGGPTLVLVLSAIAGYYVALVPMERRLTDLYITAKDAATKASANVQSLTNAINDQIIPRITRLEANAPRPLPPEPLKPIKEITALQERITDAVTALEHLKKDVAGTLTAVNHLTQQQDALAQSLGDATRTVTVLKDSSEKARTALDALKKSVDRTERLVLAAPILQGTAWTPQHFQSGDMIHGTKSWWLTGGGAGDWWPSYKVVDPQPLNELRDSWATGVKKLGLEPVTSPPPKP